MKTRRQGSKITAKIPRSRSSAIRPKSSRPDAEVKSYIDLQERLNRGLRACIDEMTAVFRFIEAVSECHDLDRILELLLEAVQDLFQYEAAALYLEERRDAEDIGGQTLKRAYRSDWVDDFRRQLKVDEKIYQWLFRQDHPIVLPGEHRMKPEAPPERWSFMLVPLSTSTERVGRLELVFSRPEGEFTQQAFSILGVLLKHAALIIANERIYERERLTARQYKELDRLKQDIVNTTTHEIKTPLTVINASSLMMRRRPQMKRDEQEDLLDTVIRQCGRIDRIINQLVETTLLEDKKVVLKREPVSLTKLTTEIVRDLLYDPGWITIRVHFPQNLNPVCADHDGIYKVIRNLIENAIKYSPRGGIIAISGENQEHSVVWQIRDHGVGIPEEDQEKIFEKFYRVGECTTRDTQGLGFGLYIVKKNVELNGGTISVKSKVGEGATFTLVLPGASSTACE